MQPTRVPFQPLLSHARYAFIADIKRAETSFVQLATDKLTGEQVAIKFLVRGWSPSQSKYVLREIVNHQHLSLTSYKRIVRFKEVFLTEDYLGVVMEHIQGPSLHDYLLQNGPRLDECTARMIFQQLILAVYFCHRTGIVNRDIAPTSVVLCSCDNKLSLKLSEFTYSKHKFRHSLPCTQVGTALYAAPEIMLSSGVSSYDGSAADVWSCGVVLYVMLFGRHPFLMPDENSLCENQQLCKFVAHVMKSELYIPPEALEWSPGGLDLCRRILVAGPAQRVTIEQILADHWFRKDLAAADIEEVYMHLNSASYASAPHQSPSHIQQLVQQACQPARAFAEQGAGVPGMPLGSNVPGMQLDANVPGVQLDAESFFEDLASSSDIFKDIDYGMEAMSNGLTGFADADVPSLNDASMFADSCMFGGFACNDGGFDDGSMPWYVDGPSGQWNAPFHQYGQ